MCFLPAQHTRFYRLNENTELNFNLNGSKDLRATLSHRIMHTDTQALPVWTHHHWNTGIAVSCPVLRMENAKIDISGS